MIPSDSLLKTEAAVGMNNNSSIGAVLGGHKYIILFLRLHGIFPSSAL